MSNRVYTYSKITELKMAPFFAEIAAIPQLTMSREMASNMAFDMRVFKGNILGFSSFVMRLFPGWNTNGQKFTYVTVLNQLLREKIANAKDKSEKDWLFGCKKNLYFAINNIIRLEEAKVHPEDIKDNDRDILLFIEMWKKLEEANDSIKDFRQRLVDLQDPAKFDRDVNNIFKFRGNKQIVWNGFQFLTPIQQFVYDCFKNAGYDIYASIQDEKRYPYANEIWNHLYTPENGYPDKKNWIRQEDLKEKNPLGEIFEHGESVSAPNIKVLKYANTIEFVEDVPRLKDEGFYIYCADDHSANNLLKDYFPERYEVRNLLSYPIGQFIYTLHKMWDENFQCITLDADGLRKCFASGWLSSHGKSSINYTDDLERLLPYFEGCYTVDQWNESYDNAYDVFSKPLIQGNESDKQREILGNPFKHFGVFSIKEKRIGEVIDIIGQLMKMAKTLFGDNEPVSIQKHMSRLDAMLYKNDGMPQELYLEEREKVKQIFEALESDKVKDFLCYPGDLATALLSFMGGKLEGEEDNNKGLRTLVFNIFQVEAAPISAKGKIHICMSDISKLPGSAGTFSWPIDEELLNGITGTNPDTYIQNWLDNNKLSSLSNRYYTYTALKNQNVEISWVHQQGDKLFSPSPYITLLDELSDAKIQDPKVRNLDLQYISGIYAKKRFDRNFDIRVNQDLHNYDSELEYSSCPMRFVYSYVLGDSPAYRNEYQQNRAIVRFIQVLNKLLGKKYSVEQIAEQVFKIFPYIRKAEKRQMIDDAIRWPLPESEGGYTTYGDDNYTNERLNLTFLDKRSYENAKKIASMLMSQEGRKGIFAEQIGKEGSRNCEFCPHVSYCMKSKFGIDYKEDQP